MTADGAFLPYGRQYIDEDDVAAVSDVLRGTWLTTGPKVEEFERAIAAQVGAQYAVVNNSGTAALHLAAMALGLRPGDKVIVPTMTFLATANAPHFTGAEIVFADVDPRTGLMTPETLSAALDDAGGGVKAIFVVHMNGQACDMEGIAALAKARGIPVVEDACHAIGTRYLTESGGTAQVGDCSHSAMACFSFHPVKTIAMGEGGAVTTNDPLLYERMRLGRSHGMTRDPDRFEQRDLAFDDDGHPNPWYYEMPAPGYNYRANDFQCALGLSQLSKLGWFSEQRKAITAAYDERFRRFPEHIQPIYRVQSCDPVLHLYVLSVQFAETPVKTRGKAMRALAARGIGTQVHYLPVHMQPYYRQRYGNQRLEGAETYYRSCLSIPIYPGLSNADIDRVVEGLESVLIDGR